MKFSHKITSKLKKTNKSKVNTIDNLNQTNVTAFVVHTGKVLTIDDINKNRSSKYNFLSF